jgi:TonB family protein
MAVRTDVPLAPFAAAPAREGLAYRDDLTGLYNRRLLSELLRDGWAALLERHGTVALMVLDLDLFKEVNDTWGHIAGDHALRAAAEQLRRHLRESDLLIRYGGDEFVAVLPGIAEDEVEGLVDRARRALAVNRFRPNDRTPPVDLPIAFSHGVAVAPRDGVSAEEVLRRADARLYEEKRRRRELLEPSRGERWTPWFRLALPSALLLGLGLVLWRSLTPAVPPALPAGAEDSAPAPAPAAAAAPSDVEGLLQQIAELQAQVQTLDQALAAERSQDNREQYEKKLRELDGTIASLPARVVATPGAREMPTPPLAAVPTTSAPPETSGDDRPAPAPPSEPRPTVQIRTPVLAAPLVLSYPRPARQLRREATVELLLTVEADGSVSSAQPVGERVGLGFEEEAQRAALRARFTPGARDGIAQRMQTRLMVRFELASR